MADFEIAELFEVMIPTIRANIRTILKPNVGTADLTNDAAWIGNNLLPDYYGLVMIMALAFRIHSPQAEVFRRWVIHKCAYGQRQPITLQYNCRSIRLSEQN